MLAAALSLFFINAFLRLRARRRSTAHLLWLIAWLQIGIQAISWLEGPEPRPWGAISSNLLILLSIPPLLWEAWVAHRQGIRAGRYVLWAWSPALLLITLWVFALQDWLPRAAVDLGSWVSFGMVLQVAVLLFGLADDNARLRRERDQAADDAEHDPLTGALNRRALRARLHELLDRADQHARSHSLIYLDLDHFKRINDAHGHAVGDQCLRELVHRIDPLLRSTDLLARIGGEEFVVVLHDHDAAAAKAIAEALRQRIVGAPFAAEQQAIAVTASLGVAAWHPGDSMEHWMRRADQALYRAKAEGRNRVVADTSWAEAGRPRAAAGETT
jgi:diguanylate cyclase (GGDEF)-like protein